MTHPFPEPEPCEIVPGRSVGSVVLGMSRDDLRSLGGRELEDGTGFFFPLIDRPEAREGIRAFVDASGRCGRIEAFFSALPPLFRLRGRIVNGLDAREVEAVFRECSPEIRHSYGSMSAPAAGISGVKWERDDADLCAIDVFPPTSA